MLVGLSHKTAPLETRESVSFLNDQLPAALPSLKEKVGECVILSTCNRTEIYAITGNPSGTATKVRDFVTDFHGLAQDAVSPHFYQYTGADAVRHLFRVAGGLDSMIVGESQILGQVRDALSSASDGQTVEVSTLGLFHSAIQTGRRVREETSVGRNPLSISYAGVKLAQRTLGDLKSSKVLLIGAGEAGRLVAGALRTVGVADVMVANRTLERAEELADYLSGRTVPFDEIQDSLSQVDIAIAATDSPSFVVTRDMVERAFADNREAPLFLFDLAVPRDVDPEVASVRGVNLFNIDDLSAIAEENLEDRKRAVVEAEAVVDEEIEKFMKWWDTLDVLPTIRALRRQAEGIRRKEMARAQAKLDGLSDDQMAVVDALTRSIVNRLLHDPTSSLKQGADNARLVAARDLFKLWDSE
ncbi:MAG: glutamyl-tRNA reductase [Chloroflexi bacterium]|nr:glutamyl-tRNA reductase [Chloroflexota bacterium]